MVCTVTRKIQMLSMIELFHVFSNSEIRALFLNFWSESIVSNHYVRLC